jgi:hypothetical protein
VTSRQFVEEIVRHIKCLGRRFVISDDGTMLFVHVEYDEPDVDDPGGPSIIQKSRRWPIEPAADESAIVETCFACVMRSYDHVVQEHFTYLGLRIYSPHYFTVSERMSVANAHRADMNAFRRGGS